MLRVRTLRSGPSLKFLYRNAHELSRLGSSMAWAVAIDLNHHSQRGMRHQDKLFGFKGP